jgi:phosphocarrier protein NPr
MSEIPSPATRTVMVLNRQGLHARAAVLLAELARRFEAKVELITGDRRRATTTDVLQTLALGAAEGEELLLAATGSDAETALEAVAQLFANKFGEDQETETQGQ